MPESTSNLPSAVWTADVTLTPEQAAHLINSQFPDLAPAWLELLGEGWDNWAYLVNGEYVFRFPRRKMGADLIVNELKSLEYLAPRLSLPVPNPTFIGHPTQTYPYPFGGYPHLPGTTACRVDWTDEERAANAAPLGTFLRALHSLPVPDEVRAWAPGDKIERANMRKRAPFMVKRTRALAEFADEESINLACDVVERLADTTGWPGVACWVHGDLYVRHLLVDGHKMLCGVIDWGDGHLGDPALDISIAFSFLPPAARPAFQDAYGQIDDDTWDRARFRAIHYAAPLIEYGLAEGDEAMRSAGEYILTNAAQ